MGDKAGKDFSLPKSKGKTSLKSSVSANGKDSSSAKSKSGRKVQFDSEDSSEIRLNTPTKSGGKFDTSNGDSGKGGKGVKTPAAKQPLELNIEKEIPENAQCLMDCEAADTVQGIQEQMVILSEDPTIKLPIYFDKGLQYAKRNDHYKTPQAARLALEPLKKHGVSDGEICLIGNLCLESIEEVFALVPSLKKKKNKLKEPLTKALSDLASCKNATSEVSE
ncbi:DNA-directed RNA polymerases IV and V subunit 4-like [Impatiens glandulifera]|uniref:DNA-directed RNA polymerases IV and V subunit 4-like n=1 Tax=Impatiens glandulifera TaxID=253017 RepID=UPI001FB0DAC5|nr:DNA-directed RNA polymerases IV and V subunit 4-like [Impatiens glandulifera]